MSVDKKRTLIEYGIFVQALLAMLGSLYFSNFGDPIANLLAGNFFFPGGFYPCRLCWWARILMYPLVFVSLIGIITKDSKFVKYILPFSVVGIFLELYHYYLQKVPTATSESCSLENPCGAMEVNYAGFITIPFLCLIAFCVITVLCLLHRRYTANRK